MRLSEDQLQVLLKQGSVSVGPAQVAIVPISSHAPSTLLTAPPIRLRGHAGKMNKTEAEYAQLLEARLYAGDIHWYRFEGMKLRLADNTFFNVDFAVLMPDRNLQFHEVKGFMRDDANVKIKVAAEQYPFDFHVIRKVKGQWITYKV
jgi:hypothetical protein